MTGVPGNLVRADGSAMHCGWQMEHPRGGPLGWVRSPYGGPGDRLWVRETWADALSLDGKRLGIAFRAGGPLSMQHPDHWRPVTKWKPGIHLRRVNARITLDVLSVRVERLHAITEEDAKAEGVTPDARISPEQPLCADAQRRTFGTHPHVGAFAMLWDGINDERPGCAWSDNPWVWRVEFSRRVRP